MSPSKWQVPTVYAQALFLFSFKRFGLIMNIEQVLSVDALAMPRSHWNIEFIVRLG